jgi:hypothetical protein
LVWVRVTVSVWVSVWVWVWVWVWVLVRIYVSVSVWVSIPRGIDMKFRQGFVSNSSSSSFIVITKCKSDDDVNDVILSVLKTPVGHPMRKWAQEIASVVADGWLLHDDDLDELEGGDLSDNDLERCRAALKAGRSVRQVNFSNESDDPMERMLYEVGLPFPPGIDDLTVIRM